MFEAEPAVECRAHEPSARRVLEIARSLVDCREQLHQLGLTPAAERITATLSDLRALRP
jgi:hypothetical protein